MLVFCLSLLAFLQQYKVYLWRQSSKLDIKVDFDEEVLKKVTWDTELAVGRN